MRVEYYKLRSMPYASCKVAICFNDNNAVYSVGLISYNTLVLKVHGNELWRTWQGYSATTARHINRFTHEFFGENLYHAWKALDSDDCFTISRDQLIKEVETAYNYANNDMPTYVASDCFHMLRL